MSGLASRTAEAWWEWCAAVSLQALVLLAVVLFFDLLLERWLARWAWPQLRTALWGLVGLKLLLPPSLSSPLSLARLEPALAGGPAVALGATEAAGGSAPALALFLIWIAGCGVLAAAAVRRYRRVRRVWLAHPAPSPRWLAACVGRAAAKLGLARVPPVRVQHGVPGPAVVGFLRPVVVLPGGLFSVADREQVEHVLLHELAHVRRRDPLAALACLALQVAFWFHPAAWLVRRRLAGLREIACDQTVARALAGETAGYRGTVLRLARALLEGPAPEPLGFLHRPGQLRARLAWLERPLARSPLRRGLATWALCGPLALCCVPLGQQDGAAPPVSYLPEDLPPLEELPGCLQLRYAVFGLMAEEEDRASTTRESTESESDGDDR